MKTKFGMRWQSPLLVTLILILLIAVVSFLASDRINRMEEQRSLDILYQESETMARELENQIASDRKQLEMLAVVAASFADMRDPRLWKVLDSYSTVGMMSDLSLLLPDGTVLASGTQEFQAGDTQSFREIAARGAHITDRKTSSLSGRYILRHYVPVVQDGKNVAMLYGTVDLQSLPDRLVFRPYGGKGALYVHDAVSGDFLLDTWHPTLTNIWTLGQRPLAPGYTSFDQFKQDAEDGKVSHIVFRSRTTGNYLYYHCRPLSINQWRLGLSVQDIYVFASANQIRTILNVFLGFEGVCFVLYFLWMFRYVRRETGEKQRQVDTLNNVYDVAKLLFGAHEHQEKITSALERIARNTGSNAAVFWMAGPGESGQAFAWRPFSRSAASLARNGIPDYIPMLLKAFRTGEQHLEAHGPAELKPLFSNAVPADMTGLVAIPLEDMEGAFCGILAVENPAREQDTCSLLRSVSFSFGMLSQNLRNYRAIRARGETDALTGLLNRNRYERDLPECRQWYQDSLACVYIDANGLHELNNSMGHEAGDNMLRHIAVEILHLFGKAHSYRIGGDEFVVFVADMAESAVSGLCRELRVALAAEKIHVSVGCQWSSDISDVNAFIKEAEGRMYEAKRRYYADRAHDRRAR